MGGVRMSPEQRRAELVQSAQELFTRNGIDKTSVSDIVSNAGVSQGTFYWYFKSKDEIVNAVVENVGEEMLQELSNVSHLPGLNSVEKLSTILSAFHSRVGQENKVMEHLLKQRQSSLYDRVYKEMSKQILPILGEIIEQGVQEGFFHTQYPHEAAALVVASCQSVFNEQLYRESPDDSPNHALMDFILHGLDYEPQECQRQIS